MYLFPTVMSEGCGSMYLTLETDYAIRIVDCLARNPGRAGAKAIANQACVTLRFSLKILRKLVASGIVRSYKGASGGYELAKPKEEISLHDVLETIEGPYTLNRCQIEGIPCTRVPGKECPYHKLFKSISRDVQIKLKSVTFADIVK